MSEGWAGEYDSAVALANAAVKKLWAFDPKHELLRFWIHENDSVSPKAEEAIRIEMKDRFWDKPGSWQNQPGVIVSTVVISNYYLAIEKVLEDRAGTPAVPAA